MNMMDDEELIEERKRMNPIRWMYYWFIGLKIDIKYSVRRFRKKIYLWIWNRYYKARWEFETSICSGEILIYDKEEDMIRLAHPHDDLPFFVALPDGTFTKTHGGKTYTVSTVADSDVKSDADGVIFCDYIDPITGKLINVKAVEKEAKENIEHGVESPSIVVSNKMRELQYEEKIKLFADIDDIKPYVPAFDSPIIIEDEEE